MIYIEKEISSKEIKNLIYEVGAITTFMSFSAVKSLILKIFETTKEELSSKTRKKEIAMKRHIFVFLMYNTTRSSLATIAKHLNRDHSTMINSRKAIVNELNYDKEFNKYFKHKLIEMYGILTEEDTPVVSADSKVSANYAGTT